MGSDDRPFHFLDRITERRYVFGLRHELRESGQDTLVRLVARLVII